MAAHWTSKLKPKAQRELTKDVDWVEPDVGYGLATRNKPGRYKDAGVLKPTFKARLVIGASMVASSALSVRNVDGYPFPSLVSRRPAGVTVPRGQLMIYAGTVRVKERARVRGETVDMDVPKHTFIVPGVGRVIIHDLTLVNHA